MASGHPIDGSAEQFTVRLPRALDAPGAARDQLRRWLEAVGTPAELVPDILLCASELVTNAVAHAGSAPTLQAMLAGDASRVRLEVTDASEQPPVKRSVGTAQGGFGIRVVDAVSTAWGSAVRPGGKVVWAEFELGS